MRREDIPRATSVDVSAIGRLLVIRSRRLEFGRDDFGRGLAINFTGRGFAVGSGLVQFLSIPQATLVALGVHAIADVPTTCHIPVPGFRYPRTDEPWVAVIPRKPAQSETAPARRERRAK